jgi:uncharacterized protein YciI
MSNNYMIISTAGPHRDHSKSTREQPYWDEHAAFIDDLIDDGFAFLGGPLVDEGGAVLVVRAESEEDVRERMADDPWYTNGILRMVSIKRWEIFINETNGAK